MTDWYAANCDRVMSNEQSCIRHRFRIPLEAVIMCEQAARIRVERWCLVVWLVASFGIFSSHTSADEPAKDDAGVVLSGRVVTEQGKPIAGAQVGLLQKLGSANWGAHRAVTNDQGRFRFSGLQPFRCFFFVQKDGFALGTDMVAIQPDVSPQPSEITLARPKPFTLMVTDPSGKALKGATLSEVSWNGPDGPAHLRPWQAKELGLRWPESGRSGRLDLNLFPESAGVSGYVSHPSLGRAAIPMGATDAKNPLTVQLLDGAEFTLRIVGRGVDVPANGFRLNLLRDGDESHYLYDEPLELNEKREFRATFLPGKYRSVLLRHPELQTLPGIYTGLSLSPGEPTLLEIAVVPRGTVTGRVVHATSEKPLAERFVEAYVHSPGDESDVYGMGPGWYYSARATTDAQGRYRIHPGVGSVRLIVLEVPESRYLSETRFLEVRNLETDQPATARDMRLHNNPVIAGTVRREDGMAVPYAVVQPLGELRYFKPAVGDRDGRFRFQVQRITYDTPADRTGYVELRAFDPYGPWERQIKVPVDVRQSTKKLDITLQGAAIGPPPGATIQGGVETESLIGKPAPQLDYQETINWQGEPLRLQQFRGKYVLLYTWATWCVPCIRQLPALESAAEVYKDHGLAVVTVHDQSVPANQVEEFVEKQGLKLPVLLDSKDGPILRSLGASGAVSIFVLVDPQGVVVLTSIDNHESFKTDLFSTLRSFLFHRPASTESADEGK